MYRMLLQQNNTRVGTQSAALGREIHPSRAFNPAAGFFSSNYCITHMEGEGVKTQTLHGRMKKASTLYILCIGIASGQASTSFFVKRFALYVPIMDTGH